MDILGREYGWEIEANSNLTKVSAGLVEGRLVEYGRRRVKKDGGPVASRCPPMYVFFRGIRALSISKPAAALLITDRS